MIVWQKEYKHFLFSWFLLGIFLLSFPSVCILISVRHQSYITRQGLFQLSPTKSSAKDMATFWVSSLCSLTHFCSLSGNMDGDHLSIQEEQTQSLGQGQGTKFLRTHRCFDPCHESQKAALGEKEMKSFRLSVPPSLVLWINYFTNFGEHFLPREVCLTSCRCPIWLLCSWKCSNWEGNRPDKDFFPTYYPIVPSRVKGGHNAKAGVWNTVLDKVCSCHVLPFSLEPLGTQGCVRKDSETPKHHRITFVYWHTTRLMALFTFMACLFLILGSTANKLIEFHCITGM